MVGKWLGDLPTHDGGRRIWLTERYPDGAFKITFRVYSHGGGFEETVEIGEWGISGPVYFTITKGWIRNDKFVPADWTLAYFNDAYRILRLDSEGLEYESFESDNRYSLRRMDPGFLLPDEEPS